MKKKIKRGLLIVAAVTLFTTAERIENVPKEKKQYILETKSRLVVEQVIESSKKYNIDKNLVFAVIKNESNFYHKAYNENLNDSKDRGLMQLNDNSFPDLKVEEFYDIRKNIDLGCKHLAWCLEKSQYNIVIALAYYNTGYGRTEKNRVPKQTLNYINNVLHYKDEFSKME